MIAIETGHRYKLQNFANSDLNEDISFYKSANPKLDEDSHDGTTNEEVLRMMIDRMNHLQTTFPCRENVVVIMKLEECLMWLYKRTEDRKARGVEGQHIN